jgi:hypothetical protein
MPALWDAYEEVEYTADAICREHDLDCGILIRLLQ